MNKAYIALGTNIEPREDYLEKATQLLQSNPTISLLQKSSIYETVPVGYKDQADFLNMVLEIQTSFSSEELLTVCQEIEQELGRKRIIRFGPRTIDLDILLFNQENKKTERLTIPHPRMHERGFVLVPLHEIAPTLDIPFFKKTVAELLDALPDQDKKDVRKWTRRESENE